MANVGEVWFVEVQGARVTAVVVREGVVLCLRDPLSESGAAIAVRMSLNEALPVAGGLLKKHLQSKRNLEIDAEGLSSLRWELVERNLVDSP